MRHLFVGRRDCLLHRARIHFESGSHLRKTTIKKNPILGSTNSDRFPVVLINETENAFERSTLKAPCSVFGFALGGRCTEGPVPKKKKKESMSGTVGSLSHPGLRIRDDF